MGNDRDVLMRIRVVCGELALDARRINRPFLATLLEIAAAETRSHQESLAATVDPAAAREPLPGDLSTGQGGEQDPLGSGTPVLPFFKGRG